MGRAGDIIGMEELEDAGDVEDLFDPILQLWSHWWDGFLTKEEADQTWAWVSMGLDSLIKLEADEDEAGFTVWYNCVPGWPRSLGQHRARAALVAGRDEMEEMLLAAGFRLTANYPTLAQVREEEYAECDCGLCRFLTKRD